MKIQDIYYELKTKGVSSEAISAILRAFSLSLNGHDEKQDEVIELINAHESDCADNDKEEETAAPPARLGATRVGTWLEKHMAAGFFRCVNCGAKKPVASYEDGRDDYLLCIECARTIFPGRKI